MGLQVEGFAMHPSVRSAVLRYGFSVAVTGVALWLRFLLNPYLGDRFPFVTYLLPIILIAWYGGLGPSIVGVALALLSGEYFFLYPRGSFEIARTADQVGFTLYSVAGGALIAMAHALRKAFRQLEANQERFRLLADSLRQGEELLRMAEHAGSVGSFDFDMRKGRARISPELAVIYRVNLEAPEESYDTWRRLVHPDDWPRLEAEFMAAFARRDGSILHEFRIIRRDGQIRWIECRAKAVYNGSGMPYRIVGVNVDVTERKEAERQLQEHTRQLQAIMDHAQDFIVRLDRDLRHQFVNRAVTEATGIPAAEFLGRTSEELGSPADKVTLWNEHVRRVFETGRPEKMEFDLAQQGATRYYSSVIAPEETTEDGEVETVLVMTRDVTEARRAQADLKAWSEQLEARVAERTAVAEQRADQLRMLAAELSEAEERERRHLAKILHDHLQQLILAARMRVSRARRTVTDERLASPLDEAYGLLDECLTESRSLTTELSPPVLYEAGLRAALDWLARQMEEKHHLRVEIDADADAEPTCEHTRIFLFQAAREMLLNTVKYAQTDSAWIEVTPLEENRLRMVVADHGVGFDPKRLEERREPGGFGLFSIRERLAVLGGRLDVDSAPGRGTRMTIEVVRGGKLLPAEEPLPRRPEVAIPIEAEEPSPPPAPGKLRVVLADDHVLLREGLAGLLRDHGVDVVGEAADGQEAVDVALKTCPEVVLMDITMPGLNGIEATRRIVQALPQTRVIGLSMHEEADMATAMRRAGAVAYLRKDTPSDVLFSKIVAGR